MTRPWHAPSKGKLSIWQIGTIAGPALGGALYALFGIVINQVLFAEGLARTTPSHSAIINSLIQAFAAKGVEFSHVLKMGRTQLQDAVPMTLGQEFEAYAVTLGEEIERLSENVRLFYEVNMGGTAIGTGECSRRRTKSSRASGRSASSNQQTSKSASIRAALRAHL